MYDILKAIAAANNWVFEYGRRDFHNLHEGSEKATPYIFLDPVQIDEIDNEAGDLDSRKYTGAFMLLYSSKFDRENYTVRYEDYIKPMLDTQLNIIKDVLRCDENIKIETWQLTEVINIFDYNFDGVIVSYVVTIME